MDEKNSSLVNIVRLLGSIVFCQAIGFAGAIFTMPAINSWYSTINKPSFNPPNWIFAPVWTILFLLMGISLYIIWKKGLDTKAVIVFNSQLALNLLWSILFFGLKLPGLAFIDLILLLAAIFYTIVIFYKISKTAGLILLPYIVWVCFAGVLNLAIFILN
ncbi:MAG: TspO/MBR family protein [Candidatus Staskawiczbacteria bacterium]|jgi:tryptophan-rich sensory protein